MFIILFRAPRFRRRSLGILQQRCQSQRPRHFVRKRRQCVSCRQFAPFPAMLISFFLHEMKIFLAKRLVVSFFFFIFAVEEIKTQRNGKQENTETRYQWHLRRAVRRVRGSITLSLYGAEDHKGNADALLFTILKIQSNYITRVSHPEPGMSAKAYYKDLREKFSAQISEVVDQINNL